jgi:hypothetical protein
MTTGIKLAIAPLTIERGEFVAGEVEYKTIPCANLFEAWQQWAKGPWNFEPIFSVNGYDRRPTAIMKNWKTCQYLAFWYEGYETNNGGVTA